MMESSSFRLLSASRISFLMLGSNCSACCRILLTTLLTVSACSASSFLMAVSTSLVIISVAGMFVGVTAKFSPFFSRAISASLRDLEDKLTTKLVLSTYGISIDDVAVCFSRTSFSNLRFCLSLLVLMTRWVLILICSRVLLGSFAERADVMLCAVDSAPFFVSSFVFCVSLIRSLNESHECKFSDSACALGGNYRSDLQIFRTNAVLDAPC